ncbi:hypothetical protein [Pseudomonas syringae]|uniref:hypothetical protein n=1 Tax=Pseudomonas syringae TaxID=317 RepID=UPI0002096276|nr:hypothetical protein [Pseudomonas syringae]EPM91970.1 hypothetical protein A259_37886 [Pseudomonas syringae pv. actinidiae ICMP 19070]EGH68604.1 hypothetical protein PSYAC_27648 [Pseudomonas syringae pv. actinidiae str. M302091]EPM44119.1 hypothetical protein A256_27123 [Pseudomonas syringae pv. actinidiae ICMP 19103]EPM99666.1 hypothetical protein A253_27679 [Pseudomonas syringae pv. actinidiae ICMP 19102]NVL23284.1 hypothetical protein [Pseudomonas syringae pv. actinidiae]
MSKLNETKRAYDKIKRLLDDEIRKRTGDSRELARFQETLDIAFYLLGWSQFEYLVRNESKEIVEVGKNTNTIDQYAWKYLADGIKEYPVRRRLDLIFHTKPLIRKELDKDYTVRNEAAHNYKHLPADAKDVSAWLQKLEALVDNFES